MCNGLETCHAGVCTPGQKAPDGLSCSDGKACNGVETCGGGICRSGPPPNCDDGDPCTTDACDNAVGGCKHIPKLDGASCSDGNFCNGKETCLAGKCIPDPLPPPVLCEDGNSCNGVEYCDHGQCMPGTPLPNGSSCADSNICDGLETCQNSRCVAGTKLDCTSTSPCAVGSCDPFSGCTAILVPDGSPCDDNNVCNGVSTCHSGTCSPTTGPPSCGALACDPVAGCVVDAHITGTKLLLRARRGGDGLNVRVQTREAISTSMPPSSGTATDPVVHGGGLRVRSLTGGFDQSFALPKQNWKYLGEPGENKGYRYRSRGSGGAIRTVVVKDGKIAKASGSASGFPTSLATDPNPVEVTLVLGNQRYCMSFGGTARFEAERRFSAEDAPMAATCPP